MRTRPGGLAVSATIASSIVLLVLAGSSGHAEAATSTTKATTKAAVKATTKKTVSRTATTRKATAASTTVASAPPTSVKTVTVVVPAPAPVTPAPTITIAPATSEAPTAAPTTTVLPNDFNIRLASPAKTVAPGESVSFVIIVEPKTPGRAVPATIIVTGLPGGVLATLEPNPITTAGELRVTAPSTLAPGFYDLRITGNASGITHSVVATLMVTGTSATIPAATTTTVTTLQPNNPGFAVTVVSPSERLRTGGTLSFPITIRPVNGFNGAVTLSVANLPAGVWAGFSDNPATASSTMWLSSSVPLVAGTYAFNLVATSGAYTQLVSLIVVLA